MDRLDELATLVAILEAGSFSGAARRLRRSPAAVTRILAQLEARAGARLVERSTRRMAATAQGRALAEQAKKLLADYEKIVAAASEAEPRGLLRVTAPVQFGRLHIAPIVTRFLEKFPDVQVELRLHDHLLDLLDEGLDIAVRIGDLQDSSLRAIRVGEVRRVFVASPAYLELYGTPRTPSDLARHKIIFGAQPTAATEWAFHKDGRDASVRLAPRLLVNDIESQLVAARAGQGVARVLSYQAAEDFSHRRLIRFMRDYEPKPSPVHLVTRPNAHLSSKIGRFTEMAAKILRASSVLKAES